MNGILYFEIKHFDLKKKESFLYANSRVKCNQKSCLLRKQTVFVFLQLFQKQTDQILYAKSRRYTNEPPPRSDTHTALSIGGIRLIESLTIKYVCASVGWGLEPDRKCNKWNTQR